MDRLNSSIGQDPESKFLIGVLDIYGFESFKINRCLTGAVSFYNWHRLVSPCELNGISFLCVSSCKRIV